jgi:hypothetical protein
LDLFENQRPGSGEKENKSHGVSEKPRGQEHNAPHQYQCSIDQFSRWHLALGKVPLDIPDNGETLVAHQRSAQYPGQDDDEDGIERSYSAPDLDEKQNLDQGNDYEDEDKAHLESVPPSEKGFPR